MLRELQVTKDKPINAMYKSGETSVVTGMAVVKKESDMTFEFPAAADTVADLFFVDKARIPTGVNAARTEMSDYDADFVNVAEDEYALLIAFYPGERFATDQYTESELEVDVRVAAGTDGRLAKATAAASRYVFKGFFDDNGHKLAIIEVSDTPVANS